MALTRIDHANESVWELSFMTLAQTLQKAGVNATHDEISRAMIKVHTVRELYNLLNKNYVRKSAQEIANEMAAKYAAK